MVLDSQMGRAGSGRMYMSSRRRRPSVRLLGAVAVVVAVVIVCIMMIDGGDDETPGNNEQAQGNTPSLPTAGDPAMTPIPPADVSPSEPTVEPAETTPPPTHTPPPVTHTPPPEPEPVTPPVQTHTSDGAAARDIATARSLVQQKRLVEARAVLNQVLASDISLRTADQVRRELGNINQQLVFSPLIDKTDPFTSEYIIKRGDYLGTIAPKYNVPWKFLQDINRIPKPENIRGGQRLKVIRGPFHLVVDKSDFRADLYLGSGNSRVFVRSYAVGLGEYNSTPIGRFVVRKHSKLEDPEWVNPRTRERFHASDPANPIGEHWIGLRGIDANTRELSGYGLHGTIEPDSIGKQASMGCVRFRAADIAQVFTMLSEEKSTVTIVP